MTVAPALQRNIPWLLVTLAWVVAPHVAHLPIWVTLMGIGLGAWRWVAARRESPLPNKWLLLLLAGAAGFGVLTTYGTITGRDAGVALLIVMLALKLMEMHSVRDGVVMIFLGYFLVITNFLYSQTILMGLYLLVAVLGITATLIGLNQPLPSSTARQRLKLATLLLAQGLPVMIVMFVLFPRAQGPLWATPDPTPSSITGLSDSMAPGSIGRLGLSNAVAFRAEFKAAPPAPQLRYWRGPVFWQYDGRTWSAGPWRKPSVTTLHVEDKPIDYVITLEPHNQRWLFALDFPMSLPPSAIMSDDYQVLATAPARQRLRYQLTSQVRYQVGRELTPQQRRDGLQLPPGYNPRSRELAAKLRAESRSDREVVARVLTMFTSQPFVYTLNPPLLGTHSVDEFLFDTRRGFCEHYAGSFVFLLRAAGIPARVVTGYQGGEHNPMGNYLIVRQSDAHAWAEAWLEGQGWVRFDPTASIAPQRVEVESGLSAALPENVALLDADWLRQTRFAWDMVNYNWHKWVLGYSYKRQSELLASLGLNIASAREVAYTLLIAIGGLLMVFSGLMMWRLRAHPKDAALAAYLRFCGKLEEIGLPRDAGEGPQDYARRVAALRPDLAGKVADITARYVLLRYRPHPERTELGQLRKQVWLFRP
ncbi:MAG: DUF3488 domain-containing transglutaminase family protein [Sulfuricella sp.]|nr:DUF3488 domain-containing transglutaminase family protein [Sulfuricella sp.]